MKLPEGLVLSVEALTPVLTGIGRYAWELASRLPLHADTTTVRFYRQGQWVKDPAKLLSPAILQKWPKWARWLKRGLDQSHSRGVQKSCRSQVFHGPNYFLPACAELGVATVHDLSIFKYPETHPLERIKQFEREFAQSMARARHLVTDSESTRVEVIQFLGWAPEKITAVPLGVSASYAPADRFDASALAAILRRYGMAVGQYTLCVSTLEPRKKIENLLQAYQLLPSSLRVLYPLVLVGGSGWLSDVLQNDIQRFKAQGWLKYLGFVPESDLPALYAGSRTFAFPSVYEGFGLPVLEAMAAGVPVVASDRSSLPEVTQGAALLGNPDDVTLFAVHLEKSLIDDLWRTQAIKRGLAVAKNLTWERCVDSTVDIYKNIK